MTPVTLYCSTASFLQKNIDLEPIPRDEVIEFLDSCVSHGQSCYRPCRPRELPDKGSSPGLARHASIDGEAQPDRGAAETAQASRKAITVRLSSASPGDAGCTPKGVISSTPSCQGNGRARY